MVTLVVFPEVSSSSNEPCLHAAVHVSAMPASPPGAPGLSFLCAGCSPLGGICLRVALTLVMAAQQGRRKWRFSARRGATRLRSGQAGQ